MTMLRHDSFDYLNSAQLARYWTLGGAVAATIDAVGRNSTSALNLNHTNEYVDWAFPGTIAEAYEHFSIRYNATNIGAILYLIDNATIQLSFHIRADRRIEVRRGTVTTLGFTSQPLPPTSAHGHLQIHWKIHSSTGVVRILLNDVEVLNLTGQNTQASGNAFATLHRFGDGTVFGGSTGWAVYIDDFVFNDPAGSVNNGFLGDVRVKWCPALAEGAQSDYTPSSGTDNAAMVDETPANDDTDYIESSTVGHIDYVTVSVSPAIPTGSTIHAIGVVTQDKKTDGGTRTARHKIRFGSGPTVANGAAFGPTTSYEIHKTIFENAITVAEVNAPMQVGVEVVT
jgi:hypothetical protein